MDGLPRTHNQNQGDGTADGHSGSTATVAALAPAAAAAVALSHEQVPIHSPESPKDGSSAIAFGASTGSVAVLPGGYDSYLLALRAAWRDLPSLTVTYERLSVEAQVPIKQHRVPSVWTFLRDLAAGLHFCRDRSAERRLFRPLQPCSGVVRPGELTLVLAPPGHGKTMLLRSLAGRTVQEGNAQLKGTVRWNGMTAEEAAQAGLQLNKLAVFVEQGDIHFPSLTVRETFQFALENSNADASLLGSAELSALQAQKVELMLELLGLVECADTVVGNALVRGVSGGQKKRVTLGELMLTNARGLFLDEISTGLDSSATFDVVSALHRWTRLMGGSAMVSLLQPAPEVVALFDSLVLMAHGHIVFQGTQAQLQQHLTDCGIPPPPDVDFAHFLVQLLTDPQKAIHTLTDAGSSDAPASDPEHAQIDETSDRMAPPLAPADVVRIHLEQSPPCEADPPLSTASLRRRYESSPLHRDLLAEICSRNDAFRSAHGDGRSLALQSSAFTRAQFFSSSTRGVWFHTLANLRRQGKVLGRSPDFWLPRLINSIFFGLVLGSLFYGLGTDSESNAPRNGLLLFGLMLIAVGNAAEIPVASEFRLVVYKQLDSGFYSAGEYVTSVVLWHLPLAVAETLVLTLFLYFMADFAPEAGRFFFFTLTFLLVDLCSSTCYRCVAFAVRNADVANNLVGPIGAVATLFSGFLLTADAIPDWLIWLYYYSPFAWGLRSTAQNEYHSSRYAPGVGDSYLRVWQIQTSPDWKWAGIGYLAGLFLFYAALSAWVLSTTRWPLTVGTKREEGDETEQTAAADKCKSAEVRLSMTDEGASSVAPTPDGDGDGAGELLPFARLDLSFSDLRYTVPVVVEDADGKKQPQDKVLLRGVNGFVRAGELLALMGSSGAGKTTLLDVLAGRKTSGQISGTILVNGHPQTFPAFSRVCGFAEQADQHMGLHTVREALHFSALLRLPSSVSAHARARFVEQILIDLELRPLADRIIGDGNAEGLSPGELKLLTIGVELSANPTILFLDEPTSGLDSRAALLVLRVIRTIARRGRSVVCTIHQPSAELFAMFDRLLLLKSGGREVYFGPVGPQGRDVRDYFLHAPVDAARFERPQRPRRDVNVASWMLDVIGAGTNTTRHIADYADLYAASPLREHNMALLREVATPRADGQLPPAAGDFTYASSHWTQFCAVIGRLFTCYWRDTGYSSVKLVSMALLGVLFGLVYLRVDDSTQGGLVSKLSIIFMGVGFMGVLQGSNALPLVFKMREAFYRERAAHTYAPWVYSTALLGVELPWLLACAVLFTVPLYWLVGFDSSPSAFFHFLLVMYLTAICFCSLGQLFASWMPNLQAATAMQGLLVIFFFLFAGVFIQKSDIPIGWMWVYEINPVSKALVSIGVSQFHCADSAGSCPRIATLDGEQTKWQFVSHYLGSSHSWQWPYVGWLLFTIAVLRILVALVIQKVSHLKR